jgi:uncharacterized protein HemX
MAENEKETKVEKPAFDPNKLLRQLEALVKSKSTELEGSHTPRRVSKSWVWAIILPVIVLAGIALFAWLSQRSNRELAKLRHEKNKEAILLAQSIAAQKVAKNDAKVAEAQKEIDASKERLRVIYADQAAEEKRYEADLHALHRIRTWDGSYRRMGG